MLVSSYSKSILAVVAAGIAVLIPAIGDNHVDATEFVNVAIAIVTAVGVYFAPNGNGNPVLKTLVAFVGAALAALVNILGGTLGWAEVSLADWLTVLLSALAAVGVYIVPNADVADDDSEPLAAGYTD